MIDMLRGRLARWWHCLEKAHRPVDQRVALRDGRVVLARIGCECGLTFWSRKA